MNKWIFPLLLISGNSMAQVTSASPYCTAQYSDDMMNVPHAIEQVQFGSLDHTSGSTQYAAPHYVFYNNLTATTLIKGQTVPLIIHHDDGTTIHGLAAWIDFNGDHDFDDAGEKVGESLWPGDDDPMTGNSVTYQVAIPQAAIVGTTRLRVRVYEDDEYTFSGNNLPVMPCQFDGHDADWGETEDYELTITSAASLEELEFSARLVMTDALLSVENVNVHKLYVYAMNGQLVGESNTAQMDLSSFTSGMYLLKVQTVEGVVLDYKIAK